MDSTPGALTAYLEHLTRLGSQALRIPHRPLDLFKTIHLKQIPGAIDPPTMEWASVEIATRSTERLGVWVPFDPFTLEPPSPDNPAAIQPPEATSAPLRALALDQALAHEVAEPSARDDEPGTEISLQLQTNQSGMFTPMRPAEVAPRYSLFSVEPVEEALDSLDRRLRAATAEMKTRSAHQLSPHLPGRWVGAVREDLEAMQRHTREARDALHFFRWLHRHPDTRSLRWPSPEVGLERLERQPWAPAFDHAVDRLRQCARGLQIRSYTAALTLQALLDQAAEDDQVAAFYFPWVAQALAGEPLIQPRRQPTSWVGRLLARWRRPQPIFAPVQSV